MGEGLPGRVNPSAFPYTRSLGPILWVFVALSSIELVVLHFLLLFWSPILAVVLSALTLATIGWLVALILSFRRLPVLVGADHIAFHVGTLKSLSVPVDAIAGVRRDVRPDDLRSREVAEFALIEHPNVVLDIAPPLEWGRHRLRAATHKLDDPDAFVRAVHALLGARPRG